MMSTIALIARDFSNAAPHYDDHANMQRRVAARCSALVAQHLMPKCALHPTILDAGCGTGFLAADIDGVTIIQLDIAEGMARVAAQHEQPVLTADMQHLPIEEASIDIMHSSLAMQWVEDVATACAEAHRTLKKGGYFIFSTLEQGSLYELATSFAHSSGAPRTLPFRHHTTYLNTLEAAGFALLHTEQEMVIERHDTPREVMKSLKSIGANYKQGAPLTPESLKDAEAYYAENYTHRDGGVTASYRVFTVIAQKL